MCPESLQDLELIRFGCREQDVTVLLLEDCLARAINDELRRMLVGLEAKLLGYEAESHVWFVPVYHVNIAVLGVS